MMKINFLLFVTAFFVCGFNNGNEPIAPKPGTEKVVELSPTPAISFIKVNISKTPLTADGANASFNVTILNSRNIMVYSATKSENEFSIYIGGLPNGSYKLLLKSNASDIETNFEVKH